MSNTTQRRQTCDECGLTIIVPPSSSEPMTTIYVEASWSSTYRPPTADVCSVRCGRAAALRKVNKLHFRDVSSFERVETGEILDDAS